MKHTEAFALVGKRGVKLASVREFEREVRAYVDEHEQDYRAQGYRIQKVQVSPVDDGVWEE